jgi:uncharacterized protein (DUF1778 family)
MSKEYVLGVRFTKKDIGKIEKAASLDHRKVTDFVRHYILITSEAILAVGAQRDFLGILGNKKIMAKVVKELNKK